MSFVANVENQGDHVQITISGPLDENSEFPEVPAAGKVVMDLEGVKYINSIGIKGWITWITPIAAQSSIEFVNCPKAIILQMNMVKNFLPTGAKVVSFYLPLFCEECDQEDKALLNLEQDVAIHGDDVKITAELPKCGEEKCEFEVDVILKKYFRFAKGEI